jgi:hypothetical protein
MYAIGLPADNAIGRDVLLHLVTCNVILQRLSGGLMLGPK